MARRHYQGQKALPRSTRATEHEALCLLGRWTPEVPGVATLPQERDSQKCWVSKQMWGDSTPVWGCLLGTSTKTKRQSVIHPTFQKAPLGARG